MEPGTRPGEAESRNAPGPPGTTQSQGAGQGLGGAAFPDVCGDFNMRIDRNGTWYYRGSPIGRLALVKLFSTVLRRDAEGRHWLTTPVENGRIEVEDAAFIAVELIAEGKGRNQIIRFRTNVDDIVTLDDAHTLRVAHDADSGEPRPYIHVRKGLEARLARAVYYHLVEIGEELDDNTGTFGVWSSGRFFPLGSLA
ncbi:MAG: DUF1285 domain-containing protein [Rhodospirillaceae bacterium]|nr:DUF1285 domain-containing protein [Rhodospirillaceae bacterium]